MWSKPRYRAGFLSLAVVCALFGVAIWSLAVVARPPTTLQEWQPVRDLPQPVASHGAVIHERYLYLVGGRIASGLSSTGVCSAAISSNGVIGECKGQSALPVPLALHAVVTSTSHLYVLGGWDEAKKTFHNQVWRAAFKPDGGLDYWEKYGNLDDNRALVLHDALIVKDRYLYVIGGQNAQQQVQKKVSYLDLTTAQPKADQELGWVAGPDLRVPLDKLSAVAKENTIYVTGGRDGKRTRDEVYYATLDGAGKIISPTWSIASGKLPEPREYHKAIVFDDKLVILGGKKYVDGGVNDDEFSSMIYAEPMAGADPTVWKPLPGLVESRQRFAAVTIRSEDNVAQHLYILGGLHGAEYRKTAYQLVTPLPDLTLVFTPTYINGARDGLIYTIRITSPYSLSNLVLRNTLPAHVSLVEPPTYQPNTIRFEQQVSQAGTVLLWHIDENPSVDVTISYKVIPVVSANGPAVVTTITNEGVEADWTYLGYPGRVRSESSSAMLPYAPDLTVKGQTGKSKDGVTELLLYTIDYQNGAYPITDVSIANIIPASVTVVADSTVDRCLNPPTTGRKPGEKLQWSIGDLQPWQHGQLFYCVRRLPLSTAETIIQNQGAEINWQYQGTPGSRTSDSLLTTFPYAANFTLQNEPRGEISQTGTITYTISFTAGPEALQNVTVVNPMPANTQLVLNRIRSSIGVALVEQGSSAAQLMRWDVSEIQAGDAITMAYTVSRTADGPILHEGAMISWSYKDEDGAIFHGETRSNGRRNPPLYQFLPVIALPIP